MIKNKRNKKKDLEPKLKLGDRVFQTNIKEYGEIIDIYPYTKISPYKIKLDDGHFIHGDDHCVRLVTPLEEIL